MVFIDDTPAIAYSIIETRARRLKRKLAAWNIALIVVDYLQLMRSAKKFENRVLDF